MVRRAPTQMPSPAYGLSPVYAPAEASGGHGVDDDVHPELGVVVTRKRLFPQSRQTPYYRVTRPGRGDCGTRNGDNRDGEQMRRVRRYTFHIPSHSSHSGARSSPRGITVRTRYLRADE